MTDVNWIAEIPQRPFSADTRIRYRHRAVPSRVSPVGPDGAIVRFEQPQAAEVAEGSIYRHFESKEALAWELFRNHFQHLALSLDAAQRPHDTLRDKAEAIHALLTYSTASHAA